MRWLLAATLLANLVLLLDDASFWDGLLLQHLALHHVDELRSWFYQAGLHPQYWLHRALFALPEPMWTHRFLSLASVFGIGFVVHHLATKLTSLTRWECLGLASLVVSYPAYHVLVSITAIIYILPTCLLYLGWALYFWGWIERRRVAYAIPAYILMFVSYAHNSLLVFHYAFVVLAVWVVVAEQRSLRAAIKRLWLVFLLPVLFQIVKSLFFTPRGAYAGYNKMGGLEGGLHRIGGELLGFWSCSSLAERVPAGVIAGVLVAALVAICLAVWRLVVAKRISTLSVGLLCFGALFYAAAIFPYVVVGKSPEPGLAWTDRYAIQTPLGIALLVVGVARILGELVRSRQHAVEYVVIGAVWLCFAVRLEQHYLRWEARAAKDAAIIAQLHDIPPPPAGTAFVWRDDVPVGDEIYRFYELGSFTYRAWGAERWLAVASGGSIASTEQSLTPEARAMYTTADFTPSGCLGEIVIAPGGRAADSYRVALAYLASSFSPARRARLERRLVRVSTTAVTCPTTSSPSSP